MACHLWGRSSLGRVAGRAALAIAGCALCLPAPLHAQTAPAVPPDGAPAPAEPAAPVEPPAPAPVQPAAPAEPPAPAAPVEPATPAEPAASVEPPVPPAAPSEPAAAVEPAAPEPESPEAKRRRARTDDDDDGVTGIQLGARLMVGFEHEGSREAPSALGPAPSQTDYGFEVRQIRLRARGELADLFRASVTFDLADALSPELGTDYDTPLYLRTASIEYRPSKAFRLRVGRFKRPLSHLELTSTSDLPVLRRGLFNDLALEDNQWGDRAVGAMASGRISAPKLRWALSLMNPNWNADEARRRKGLDVVGRLEWTLVKKLVIGANAAYKNLEHRDERVGAVAYGGDIAWEIAGVHLLLESNSAPSVITDADARPRALGVLFMADYELPLSATWSLQPMVFAEYADANTQVYENESLRLAFALNALGHGGFRVMPQVDLVRPLGDFGVDNPWDESTRLSLIFSLVL